MTQMLQNISVVLVEPQGDENVGMAARAMKNCGIADLRLVSPAPFRTKAAFKWACNAADILTNAKVFSTLRDALSDISLSVGLSRREGKLRPPVIPFHKAGSKLLNHARKGRVALIFGREDDGLKRSELDKCDFVWTISTSEGYPSLNLAQAVLLACHEVFLSAKTKEKRVKDNTEVASAAFASRSDVEVALECFSRALLCLGYDNRDGGMVRRKIVHAFGLLFARGGLRRKDVNMFLGLAARIEERTKRPNAFSEVVYEKNF